MSGDNGSNSRQQVAAELKRVREAAELSQEQMATRLGMVYAPGGRKVSTGRATVSAWERCRRTPSAEQLQVYVDLGGDPMILTSQADLQPSDPGTDALLAASTPGNGLIPTTAPASEPALTRRPRRGLRWDWAAVQAIAVVAAMGTALLVAAVHGGSASRVPPTTRSPRTGGPPSTWTETTGTPAHTWVDPVQLTGGGTPLGPRQSVQVLCRIRGYVVPDGDPWWYRLASAPWNGDYYATSDAFYNNGDTSGPWDNGVIVDEQVPLC